MVFLLLLFVVFWESFFVRLVYALIMTISCPLLPLGVFAFFVPGLREGEREGAGGREWKREREKE